MPPPGHKLRFGPFELDPTALELRKLDRRIRIRPQACKLLVLLVRHTGEVVSREELRRHLWNEETFVDFDHSLNFCIRQIRSALGENADAPRYIETVPRVGYRFAATARPAVHSIAILPFRNTNCDPEVEYLSDGMTESLIRQLAVVPGLQVMARSTVFRFKKKHLNPIETGRKLCVGAVVTGGVLEREGKIEVTIELVDVDSGAQLWGGHYIRPFRDIVQLQSEIPAEISEKLNFRLSGEQRKRAGTRSTEDPEAYRWYLRGRYSWNKRMFEPAIQHFRRSLDADPLFALAYAGLADCYGIMGFYGYLPPRESWPKAKAAALKGLEIDADISEAHAALGFANLFYDWDPSAGAVACRRAIGLNPNNHTAYQYYSCSLIAIQEHQEAIECMEKGRDLDPLSAWSQTGVAFSYYFARDYNRAEQEARKALELDPDLAESRRWLGISLVQLGRHREAIPELRAAVEGLGDTPAALGSLSRAYGCAGMLPEVQKIIDQLQAVAATKKVAAASLAVAHLSIGNKDAALDWLARAVDNRSSWLIVLDAEPWWDPLRSDPRFQEIRKQIGIAGVTGDP
jgi:TolB-like protein/Flp pilus assembly protein TadD